jgi:hypothetical protein
VADERRRPRSGGQGRLSGDSPQRRPGRRGLSPSEMRLGGSSGESCSGPGTLKGSGGIRMRCSPSWQSCTGSWRSSARRSPGCEWRSEGRTHCLGENAARVARLATPVATRIRIIGGMELTPEQRSLRARIAAYALHASPRSPRDDQARTRRVHGQVRAAGRPGRKAPGGRAAPACRRGQEGLLQRPGIEVGPR